MSAPAKQMKSANGSQELTRLATAYMTSIAFGVTFLTAQWHGVDGTTALGRSVVAAFAALVGGSLLAAPVVDVVLAAMARDEAKRRADERPEDGA